MKLATVRGPFGTRCVRVDEHDVFVDLGAADLGALLDDADWQTTASRGEGDRLVATSVGALAPVVPRPGKIICVGLNYRHHIAEMGRAMPTHPTLFAKFAEALVGPNDSIVVPPESAGADWEAELAVVIGRFVRRASASEAAEAIAGFTILNDITMRDWQYRTTQWLQGKSFESTTPLGPVMTTPDEVPGGSEPSLTLTCHVNGERVQEANTSDLVFGPIDLIRYISTIITLSPGDVIATGTPGGVGHAQDPPRHLVDGDTVVTRIEGLGELRNVVKVA
jgi:acylpyruvate hydrolase